MASVEELIEEIRKLGESSEKLDEAIHITTEKLNMISNSEFNPQQYAEYANFRYQASMIHLSELEKYFQEKPEPEVNDEFDAILEGLLTDSRTEPQNSFVEDILEDKKQLEKAIQEAEHEMKVRKAEMKEELKALGLLKDDKKDES